MTRDELETIPAFARLPVRVGSDAVGLLRPLHPQYTGAVYDAAGMDETLDFLRDPALVPVGVVEEGGQVRAIFWQRRSAPPAD